MSERIVTAVQVERRLLDLSTEVDSAYDDLKAAEMEYHTAKATYEVEYARATLYVAAQPSEERTTAAVRDSRALLRVEGERMALATAEAVVAAARANARRLQTQVDLARSVGTTLRASIDMAT